MRIRHWFVAGLIALAAGCGQGQAPEGAPRPPVVPVSQPVRRDVIDYVEYTGRINAINPVDIKARVSGYLVRAPFREGAEVKRGDLLFEVDPRPYQAQLDQALGHLGLYEAQLKLAKANLAMDQALARTPGAVSQYQLNVDEAAVEQAQAGVTAYQASLKVYELNLAFTRVLSPVDGQVSRYYLTPGNLVLQDQTLLTTVVTLDPMYVYFDMDQRTLLRILTAINEGRIKMPINVQDLAVSAAAVAGLSASQWWADVVVPALVPQKATTKVKAPVFMGLESESGFPHKGYVDFMNNQVNPSTGTIAVRGVFANPKPENGVRLLKPGMFVRVRLPLGEPHPALLVSDAAVGSDQGLRFVYVLDKDNKIEYRRVTTGALQEDGLRVIEKGLDPNDRVVVAGLQQVRPRMQVEPEPTPMPTLGPEGNDGAADAGGPQPPPPGGGKK
jgi:multidrug efflux system membrane fusion protein